MGRVAKVDRQFERGRSEFSAGDTLDRRRAKPRYPDHRLRLDDLASCHLDPEDVGTFGLDEVRCREARPREGGGTLAVMLRNDPFHGDASVDDGFLRIVGHPSLALMPTVALRPRDLCAVAVLPSLHLLAQPCGLDPKILGSVPERLLEDRAMLGFR